jgi:hypothetical protein
MILVLSLVLGMVPLAGVVWIFATGMITLSPPSATVDGLFMTLILLTLSGCFFLNAFWEMRDRGLLGKQEGCSAGQNACRESQLDSELTKANSRGQR